MSLISKIQYVVRGVVNHTSPYYNRLFYYIGTFLPIQKGLVLFESQPDFCDNSLCFYQYLRNQQGDLRLEWIVSNSSSQKIDDDIKINCKFGFHAQTYLKIARAEFIFFSHNYPYFKHKNKRQTVVYMTHGCPIKKNKPKDLVNPPLDYTETPNFDYALCIGNGAINPQSIFCMCRPERVLPLGYPRNDDLIAAMMPSSQNPFWHPGINKIILWMPTFRASVSKELNESESQNASGLPIIENADQLSDLNNFFRHKKSLLLIKIHRLQAAFPIFNETYSNILFLTDALLADKSISLYDMVAKTDALLTDYSSIYFDYLLLDHPIGFTLADFEEYGRDRGYVFDDTKSMLAGHHIYNYDNLLKFVSDVCADKDPYCEHRKSLKEYFHADTQISSSERIARHFHLLNEPISTK